MHHLGPRPSAFDMLSPVSEQHLSYVIKEESRKEDMDNSYLTAKAKADNRENTEPHGVYSVLPQEDTWLVAHTVVCTQ